MFFFNVLIIHIIINMKNNIKNKFLVLFSIIILPKLVKAEGVLDAIDCVQDGSCGLSEMETGVELFITRLVGLIGAAALLFLIYGGLRWLTSGGRSKDIEAGKNIVIGSITAIIIALLAGLFIRFYTEDVFKVKEYIPNAPPPIQGDP